MGIIPAYAGNTSHPRRRTGRKTDHPRVCGEHFSKQVRTVVYVGSSPRMRGTLQQAGAYRGLRGIIPAYAGNTPSGTVTSTA